MENLAWTFGQRYILISNVQGSGVSWQRSGSVGEPTEDEGAACQPAADADHRLGDVHPVFAGGYSELWKWFICDFLIFVKI